MLSAVLLCYEDIVSCLEARTKSLSKLHADNVYVHRHVITHCSWPNLKPVTACLPGHHVEYQKLTCKISQPSYIS